MIAQMWNSLGVVSAPDPDLTAPDLRRLITSSGTIISWPGSDFP